MEIRSFSFTGKIQGQTKSLIVKAPVENGGVYTHKYCPQDLLTGGLSFIRAVNGEKMDEFISDCQKQIIAIGAAGNSVTRFEAHVAGLMAVVMEHINRCGRLIFGDLLIYMDIFSLILEADGLPSQKIKDVYPRITRKVVELYPNYIFNTSDLSPFKGSHFDLVLYNVSRR